jgi:hypothetical protein
MSAQEFDELTKALAAGHSRRSVLGMLGKVLLAGTAVGGLMAAGSGVAGAARPHCIGNETPCGPNCCRKGQKCVGGKNCIG